MTEELDGQQKKALIVSHAELTDIGLRREENQDSYGVTEQGELRAYIVADGMGGVKGGAVASSIAVECVKRHLLEKNSVTAEDIRTAIEEANTEIFARGSTDPALVGMGTTLVALIFSGATLHVASVGDSRAYLLRRNQFTQITEDHTLVMELLRSGTITRDQAENHPVAHMLTRSLGPSGEVEVDCRVCAEGPYHGDKFLLCSDGLYNMLDEARIAEILKSEKDLSAAVRTLVEQANQAGGSDNITAIVIELGEGFLACEEGVNPDVEKPCDSAADTGELSRDATSAFVSVNRPVEDESRGLEQKTRVASDSVEHDGETLIKGPHEEPMKEEEFARSLEPMVDEELEKQRRMLHALKNRMEQIGKAEPEESEAPARRSGILTDILGWIPVLILAGILGFAGGVLLRFSAMQNKMEANTGASLENPAAAVQSSIGIDDLLKQAGTVETKNEAAVKDGGEVKDVSFEPVQQKLALPPEEQNSQALEAKIVKKVNALVRRQNAIGERLKTIEELTLAFEGPLSGKLGEMLNNASLEREELQRNLDQARGELETEYKALSLWYDRRSKLEGADPLNFAGELASVSAAVRDQKQVFESTTWEYLTESEKLKYNPADGMQSQRVQELLELRKKQMSGLSTVIKQAIEEGIAQADRRIADLTLKRDELDMRLKSAIGQVEVCRVMIGNDLVAKEEKKRALLAEQEQLKAEQAEISRVSDLASLEVVSPPIEELN